MSIIGKNGSVCREMELCIGDEREQPWYLCGKGRYIEQHVAFGVHAVEAVARFL